MFSDHVRVSQHPLVLHKLTLLRNRETEPKKFRELLGEITQLLFYEATHHLPVAPMTVETPLGPCDGFEVDASVGVVPILRAGLGMVDAVLAMAPNAKVWHLGVYRDHKSLQPVVYYQRLPKDTAIDLGFVLDPMLATGGSAIEAVSILKRSSPREIVFLGIIASPEGVRALTKAHPDIKVYLAAVDSHLNEKGYIIPGLGDAGDRQYGTGEL